MSTLFWRAQGGEGVPQIVEADVFHSFINLAVSVA